MAGNLSPVVLDTHTLLWWTLDPEMLSDRAREMCARIHLSGAIISSISIWEIGIKIKRKKIDIGLDISTYTSRLRCLESLLIVPIDENIWIQNLELDWDHRDPADRTIVATAMVRDADLITKDNVIRRFYERAVW
jgi:PIN domain nuclease of toxin-antitoxin system